MKIAYVIPMLITHEVEYQATTKSKSMSKIDMIESVKNSIVLIVAE